MPHLGQIGLEVPLGVPLGGVAARAHRFDDADGAVVAYELEPWISLGLETQARMFWQPETAYGATSSSLVYDGLKLYTGPTISLAGKRVWWDLNFSVRAVGEHDDARYLFRVLWGIFL